MKMDFFKSLIDFKLFCGFFFWVHLLSGGQAGGAEPARQQWGAPLSMRMFWALFLGAFGGFAHCLLQTLSCCAHSELSLNPFAP